MSDSTTSIMIANVITTARLISSTVPETDHSPYNSGTTYGRGDRCISSATHLIYESQQAGNAGHDPDLIQNRSGVLIYWAVVDPTNRWAMFDGEVSTQTVAASSLTVVVQPGSMDSMFIRLEAEGLSISIKDSPGGSVIYTYTSDLETSEPADYDEWCFMPFMPQTSVYLTGIDQYSNPEVTVTLTSSGTVKCGVLAFGVAAVFGSTMRGASVEPKSFARTTTDKITGKTTIIPGKSAKDISASVYVDIAAANWVVDVLTSTLGVPAFVLCSAERNYAALNTFGLARGKMTYDDTSRAILALTVEGTV